MQLLNTLYVTNPDSYLHLDNDTLRVEIERETRLVVTAYQERKQESLTHPLLDTGLALGIAPFVQARLLARAVRGDAEGYLPFCPK